GANATFPLVQGSGGYYTLSSQVTVAAPRSSGWSTTRKMATSSRWTPAVTSVRATGPPSPARSMSAGRVTMVPPSLEDLFLSQNATVACVATNLKSFQDVKFSWSRSGGQTLEVATGPVEELPNGLYRLSSLLKICADEWNSGETFTCTVTIPELGDAVVKSIKKDTGPTGPPPSVFVFPPPAEELANQETATLTCLATGFRPGDILVTWTQEDRPVSSGSFLNFGPEEDGGAFTLYSMLEVPVAAWQRGDHFACVVGHEGIPLNFVQKTLDKSVGKPTNVNVSVILSDSDVTCY
uniref:Ig-like domain-containing protein n=1 Tax=Strix occidentalis caurina TaxID=311401 RepID=A0A8D0KXV5_STROC